MRLTKSRSRRRRDGYGPHHRGQPHARGDLRSYQGAVGGLAEEELRRGTPTATPTPYIPSTPRLAFCWMLTSVFTLFCAVLFHFQVHILVF